MYKDTHNLLSTVFPYIKWSHSWKELVFQVENCTHEVKVTTVLWKQPLDDMVKLNTDGSAMHSTGNTTIGGILRNNHGDFIFSFASPLGEGNNNQAEFNAAIFGLSWCIQLGYRSVILEVDSELLTKWIKHRAQPPWSIIHLHGKLQNITKLQLPSHF